MAARAPTIFFPPECAVGTSHPPKPPAGQQTERSLGLFEGGTWKRDAKLCHVGVIVGNRYRIVQMESVRVGGHRLSSNGWE
jgi:hypothetical protein